MLTSTLQSFRKLIFQNGFSVSQLFETTASLPDLKILSGRCIQVGVNITFFQKFSAMNIVYHLQKCNETTEITDFLKYFENNLARAAAHLSYLLTLQNSTFTSSKVCFLLACTITWFYLVNMDKGGRENKWLLESEFFVGKIYLILFLYSSAFLILLLSKKDGWDIWSNSSNSALRPCWIDMQLIFTCSKSSREAVEKGWKYVQS